MTIAIVFTVLLALMGSLRYPWWKPAVPMTLPRILMYHMICDPVPGARFNGLRVSPQQFERQLAWLRRHGWQFRFLSDVVSADALRQPGSEKVCVITFDDGYADNLYNALPILQRHGAVATLYLVQHRDDNDWSVKKKQHHDEGELAREPKLTDGEVETLLASGCFELGGHSATHADFSKLDPATRRAEIEGSKSALEARFGVPLQTYAYPFGIYDGVDVALVREAGFLGAVTTRSGISRDLQAERFELKRVKVSGKKGQLTFRLGMRMGWRTWG